MTWTDPVELLVMVAGVAILMWENHLSGHKGDAPPASASRRAGRKTRTPTHW
jgi:hypothetical protein